MASNGRLSGVRVMVVEEHPDQLAMVFRLLTEAGAQVRGLLSGQEAYDEVHADPPDVLITELKLPDVSGLTLVSRVRVLPGAAHTCVVAFTADQDVANRDQAIRSGVEYFVPKPDATRLVHVVAHAAGRGQ